MMFGLSDADISYIRKALSRYREITEARVFGSRALGSYKDSSDIDIAIYGQEVTMRTISSLKAQLEELSPFPYFVDIVDATHLSHEGLLDHIQRVGITFYPEQQT